MKKLLFITAFTLSLSTVNVQAQNTDNMFIQEFSDIEYLSDGYYVVTTISSDEFITPNANILTTYSTSKTKTATKHSTYYNSSNKPLWTVNLSATFSYNGSTSTCTKVSCSVSDIKNGWSLVSKSASKSGNKATGKIQMHQTGGGNISKTITMTCNSNGTLK